MRIVKFYLNYWELQVTQSYDVFSKDSQLTLYDNCTRFNLSGNYDRFKFEFWNESSDELCAVVIWDNQLNKIHKFEILDPDFKLKGSYLLKTKYFMHAKFEHGDVNLRIHARKSNRSWAYIHRLDLTGVGSAVPGRFKDLCDC